jgi:hypothetical protein
LITVAAAEVNNGFTMDQIEKITPEELLELRIRLFITGFLHAHLVSWSYQPQQIVPNAATDDSHSRRIQELSAQRPAWNRSEAIWDTGDEPFPARREPSP